MLEIEEELLLFIGGLPCTKVQTFYRIELREVFYSSMFIRAKKRNSFTISYLEGGCKKIGKIKKFICLNGDVFAVLTTLNIANKASESFDLDVPAMDYASKVFQVEEQTLVPAASISKKCVCVELDVQYVIEIDGGLILD